MGFQICALVLVCLLLPACPTCLQPAAANGSFAPFDPWLPPAGYRCTSTQPRELPPPSTLSVLRATVPLSSERGLAAGCWCGVAGGARGAPYRDDFFMAKGRKRQKREVAARAKEPGRAATGAATGGATTSGAATGGAASSSAINIRENLWGDRTDRNIDGFCDQIGDVSLITSLSFIWILLKLIRYILS